MGFAPRAKVDRLPLRRRYAIVALLELQAGYTGPTWSLMRSMHEVNRLLAATSNPEEERIPRRWLADQEVKQAEARAAEQAEAARIADEMRDARVEPVGYERFKTSVDGGPAKPTTVRVTHVYRREDGEWKIVHRHGDIAPMDESPPAGPPGAAPSTTP